MTERLSWEQTWMGIADVMAKRSVCSAAQVGAIIVDPTNRPVSTGYNGPPRYFPRPERRRSGDVEGPRDIDCAQWCERRATGAQAESYGLACPTIHAEANALMFADRRDYEGGSIYVTASCCADCAKLISNSGLLTVHMRVREEDSHRNPVEVTKFMQRCGLEVRWMT